jgi:hypothetical protein
MAANKKPRKRYKPKPVYTNALDRAIESATPIGQAHSDYYTDMLIKNHGAMQALTQGRAAKRDMDLLIAMANIMEAFRRMDVCAPLGDEIAAGRRALIDISVRAVKHLRFVATGPEILALNTLMELHDELMPHITGLQLDRAIALAKKTIRAGQATVLTVSEKFLEEAAA